MDKSKLKSSPEKQTSLKSKLEEIDAKFAASDSEKHFSGRATADVGNYGTLKLEADETDDSDIEEYYKNNNKKFRVESNKINPKMPENLTKPEAVLKAKQMEIEVGIDSQQQVTWPVTGKSFLTKVNNPLLMPEILEQIFDFMQRYQDEKTMLNICGVSKLWNEIMRKRMAKFETTEILQCPPSPIGPTSPTCKKFYLTLPIDDPCEFRSFCKTTGRQMKELNISFKTCLEEADQVYPINDTSIDCLFNCVQQFCPFVSSLNVWRNPLDIPPLDSFFKNSNILSLKNTNNYWEPNEIVLPFKEIVNMFWNDERGCDLLKQIIIRCPYLDSLTFMHSNTKVMIEVLRLLSKSPNKLNKLTSLRTIGMGINNEFINFVLGHEWSLTFLDIEINDEAVSSERIRALLNHLGKTLKTIKIKFMDLEFNFGPSVQEKTWLLPVSMKALQCVELVLPSLSATACSSFFVNLLQLPHLKSFKLSQTARNYESDDADDIEEDLNHLNLFGILWNGHGNVLQHVTQVQHTETEQSENRNLEISEGTSSKSKAKATSNSVVSTIEKLNVSQTMTDASLFQQIPNPLENLIELKLQSVSVDVILAIFASLKNLERLSFIADTFENVGENTWDSKYWLNFSHLNERILDWDEILTGRMKKDGNGGKYAKDGKEKPEFLMLSTSPSITNLHKLKYLYIIPMDAEVYLTDFFIYYGAFHLKGLQHLVIRENYFTDKAVEDLREELLPFCHVEVKCD